MYWTQHSRSLTESFFKNCEIISVLFSLFCVIGWSTKWALTVCFLAALCYLPRDWGSILEENRSSLCTAGKSSQSPFVLRGESIVKFLNCIKWKSAAFCVKNRIVSILAKTDTVIAVKIMEKLMDYKIIASHLKSERQRNLEDFMLPPGAFIN